jgi:hypothetical protein
MPNNERFNGIVESLVFLKMPSQELLLFGVVSGRFQQHDCSFIPTLDVLVSSCQSWLRQFPIVSKSQLSPRTVYIATTPKSAGQQPET